MNFKEFKSGNFIQQYKYKSFMPNKINRLFSWDEPEINILLENANHALGELNAFTKFTPDIDMFIQMHIKTEANKSSKIEGTKIELDDVIMPKEIISPEKRDDWQEVNNYIEAVNFSIDKLHTLPVSNRLIKQTHKILLQNVRGKDKHPGEFRTSQNWIGGNSISDATFIPPNHTQIAELMGDLENFIHNEQVQIPKIIKIALIHYQFETIHPFLDGNGRIGRLLITLYLVDNNIIDKPSLYLSDYFEKHKTKYYDLLMGVRLNNDITSWIKFFLSGVIRSAHKGVQIFQDIMKLKKDVENSLFGFGNRAKSAHEIVNYLYKHPILTANIVSKMLKIIKPTANILIKELEKCSIVKEITGKQRNKVYVFEKYLKIFA